MANDYSESDGMVAAYRMEDAQGATCQDELENNDLTPSGTGGGPARSGTHAEGSYSASFNNSSSHYLMRSDTNLSSGFPFKSGESNTAITISCFFYVTSHIATNMVIASKYDTTGNQRGFTLQYIASDNMIKWYLSDGTTAEILTNNRSTVTGVWYHIVACYDPVTKVAFLRVRQQSDDEPWAKDVYSTLTITPAPCTSAFVIGARQNGGVGVGYTNYLYGRVDELIVWDRYLKRWEMDEIYKMRYTGSQPKNIYHVDHGMVAVYLFECESWPSTLIRDELGWWYNDTSRGENYLQAYGPTGGSSLAQSGIMAAWFARGDSEYANLNDATLQSDFPYKSGNTTLDFSVCLWIRLRSHPAAHMGVLGKYDGGSANKKSFLLYYNYNGNKLAFQIGNGASVEELAHATSLSATTWYHVTLTYEHATKTQKLWIRDTSGNTVGTDVSRTVTLTPAGSGSQFAVGCYRVNGTKVSYLDADLDEIIVWKRAISTTESEAILDEDFPLDVAGGGKSMGLLGIYP